MEPDPDEIEPVARAMCAADGIDPDMVVQRLGSAFREQRGSMRGNADYDETGAAWLTYRRAARQHIAAQNALVAHRQRFARFASSS